MSKTIVKVETTCNNVNKRIGNDQVRFDINGDGQNGNVNINMSKNDDNKGLDADFEPGEEYVISIKKKS